MCGRYSLSTPGELVAEMTGLEDELELEPRFNIAPTDEVPIVDADAAGKRTLHVARWGLVPSWARDLSIGARTINARSETVAETRAFRDAFRARRCLVPADGFYEWQKRVGGKQTFHLTLEDGAPFVFAGLYELWRQAEESWLRSFTILTTEPNSLVSPIHDRMPVILPPEAQALWLDGSIEDAELLRPLMTPLPAEQMKWTAVGSFVNRAGNEGPKCVEPVEIRAELQNLSLWD